MQTPDVLVIGAGPAGLAAAAALRARGRQALVVDRADAVGSTWRAHYDRLHLHTPRGFSHLPGLRIPRRFGRWVARADVVRYLEMYAAHHRLDLRLGTSVEALERDGAGWAVTLRSTASTDGADATSEVLHVPAVVVATGYNHTPLAPTWPGVETFTGDLVHAAAYRNGKPYAGRDVLVVGPGNTGAEISTDLADWGAARVRLALRTPPHLLPRSQYGWPTQATGIAIRHLPVPLVDRLARALAPLQGKDLTAYGWPRPSQGLYTMARNGRIPVQDVGIADAVRAGRVEIVAAVERVEGAEVVLADGSRVRPDVVVVATGYARGLEPLVGRLGVLDARGLPVVHGPQTAPAAPGLYFLGFTNPISGMFREIRIDAVKIAAAIAGR